VIRLSRKARTQLSSLAAYYEDKHRPEAVRNLRAAITRASERIETQRGLFFSAPRPYRTFTHPRWIWLKEGTYWIAYSAEPDGAVIQVVFHEAADIPNRI
jgi:plasmid stabilization system protein ParE